MAWRPFGHLAGVVPVEPFHHRVEEIRGYRVDAISYTDLETLYLYHASGNSTGCFRTHETAASLITSYNRKTGAICNGPDANGFSFHAEGAPDGVITNTEVEPIQRCFSATKCGAIAEHFVSSLCSRPKRPSLYELDIS